FGMQMPGRAFTVRMGYRYGFNGKEEDSETGMQDYGMRIFNPAISKFLSVDPLTSKYPELTPYQFASNRPIDGIDLDGLEHYNYNGVSIVHDNIPRVASAGVIELQSKKPATQVKPAQLKADELSNSRAPRYPQVAVIGTDIYGNHHIGPEKSVNATLKAKSAEYHSNNLAAIATGPGAAIGYIAAKEKGIGFGAAADGLVMSLGGINPNESIGIFNTRAKGIDVRNSNWVDHNGNFIWPSREGFATEPTTVTLKPGDRFNRYGSEAGTFASPAGTPLNQRAMAPGSTAKPLTEYEVLKPFDAKAGKTAPWFGEPGGGTQYKFDRSVSELKKAGIIRAIPPKTSQ
ncbi:DUF4237 domain-containing protein, partial [Flaviaesturariibacter flavus]